MFSSATNGGNVLEIIDKKMSIDCENGQNNCTNLSDQASVLCKTGKDGHWPVEGPWCQRQVSNNRMAPQRWWKISLSIWESTPSQGRRTKMLKKAANAIKSSKTVVKIGSWKFCMKQKSLLWHHWQPGDVIFHYNPKKLQGLCPVMSSVVFSKRSAPKRTQLTVSRRYESTINLASLLWKCTFGKT